MCFYLEINIPNGDDNTRDTRILAEIEVIFCLAPRITKNGVNKKWIGYNFLGAVILYSLEVIVKGPASAIHLGSKKEVKIISTYSNIYIV